jgi:hypothetical protein
MKTRIAIHLTALLLIVGSGCEKSSTDPGRALTSIVVQPANPTVADGQSAQLGVVFGDQNGQAFTPIPAPTVSWSSSNPGVAEVASNGVVAGERPGQATITAAVGTLRNQTVVTVTAVATQLAEAGGNNQSGTVGSALAEPVVVVVRDRHGVGVPGIVVEFAVTVGNGSLSSSAVQSDAEGYARAVWTLGTGAGENRAEARASGLAGSPVALAATGMPGHPVTLEKVSGDAQTGTVGAALPSPVLVRVKDTHGHPVRGVSVTWSTISGGGTATPLISTTDGDGSTQSSWTLGAAGENRLRAAAAGLEVVFTATAERPQLDCAEVHTFGDGAELQGELPSVQITGNVRFVGPASICGNLGISGSGRLRLNGQAVTVAGNLHTSGSARLLMYDAADRLTIAGDAAFENGNAVETDLTAGRFELAGNLSTNERYQRFLASGTHRVVLNGTRAQTVDLRTEIPFGTHNRFRNLDIENPAGVTFISEAIITGELRSVAASRIAAGTLRLGGTTDVRGDYAVQTTIFYAADQAIQGGVPYHHVVVTASVTRFAGATSICGDLRLDGTGQLRLNGQTVQVAGDFRARDNGRLLMQNAADRLIVRGNAVFEPMSAVETDLTAGRLELAGNLSTNERSHRFLASGTHRVVLNGTAAQTVDLRTETALSAHNRFRNLDIENPAGVTFVSNARTTASLDLIRQMTVPSGVTLSGIQMLILRSASVLNNSGTLQTAACTREAGHTINGTNPCP